MTAVTPGGEHRLGDVCGGGGVGAGGGIVRLATVESAVDAFCEGFDPSVLAARDAAGAVQRLSVLKRRIEAAEAGAARRVDASSIWKHAGHRSAAEWMATQTGDPLGSVTNLLDTARRLDACPATADAFASGAVSVSAAREIAGATALDPGAEATLLSVAVKEGHRQLVDTAARVRQAAHSKEDEATRHGRLRARRFARTRVDPDGLVLVHAGFAPKDWAPFAHLWQRGTDAEFTLARREGRREGIDAYAADALLTMLAAGQAEPPRDSSRIRPELAAGSCESSPPDAVTDGSVPRMPPMKAEVLVLVDGIALRRGHVGAGERCEIVGVGPVDVGWVRELLPEAIVHALVHDGVDITTYASATRAVRKAVRLAVKARDWCCVVRGCGRARRVQRDHRREFALGGLGSTDNLNLLCLFHHNQKSRAGARLERHGEEWHWWPPPPSGAQAGALASHSGPWRSPVGASLMLWDVDPP